MVQQGEKTHGCRGEGSPGISEEVWAPGSLIGAERLHRHSQKGRRGVWVEMQAWELVPGGGKVSVSLAALTPISVV